MGAGGQELAIVIGNIRCGLEGDSWSSGGAEWRAECACQTCRSQQSRFGQDGERHFTDVATNDGVIEIENHRQMFAGAATDEFFKVTAGLAIPTRRFEQAL